MQSWGLCPCVNKHFSFLLCWSVRFRKISPQSKSFCMHLLSATANRMRWPSYTISRNRKISYCPYLLGKCHYGAHTMYFRADLGAIIEVDIYAVEMRCHRCDTKCILCGNAVDCRTSCAFFIINTASPLTPHVLLFTANLVSHIHQSKLWMGLSVHVSLWVWAQPMRECVI